MAKKNPFLSYEKAKEIKKEFPTPFHIYNEQGIRRTARALRRAFSWNPGFKEFFAVKATPNPFILDILKEEGCGADCSSEAELVLSSACGLIGSNVMFSSNETTVEEFKKAINMGAYINLDDISLIETLEEAGKIPEIVCCRYNPGGELVLGNEIMDDPKDAKYGMTEEQLLVAFEILKKKGVKKFGIHSFLASNVLAEEYYPYLAEVLFQEAVKVYRKTGVEISFINLSGGIGIPYHPDDREIDISKIGELVKKQFEQIMIPAGLKDTSIFTELGRFMLAEHGALITTAEHEKKIYKNYIGVDACACNLMRPAMYGAYHHITVLGKENASCDHLYDVVGSLCENNDKFAVDRMLPQIERGDILYIHDTGAHGFSMGYNYNGKLRSAELLLKSDGTVKMIRRAETLCDLFATFDFTDYRFE